jgi:toxin ParE1/3/4
MSRIRFTAAAENDLLELWVYIAEENPAAADEALDEIKTSVSALAEQPEMGRARPELADGLRSMPTRTPYIVYYEPDREGVLVLRVLHHARDVDTDGYF